MRKIKFRGRTVAFDTFVYGDLLHSNGETYIIDGDDPFDVQNWHCVDPESVAQYICDDGDCAEIYEGDALDVNFDALQKYIGKVLIIQDLLAVRPREVAKLKFLCERGRFRLYWTLPNGKVDTGIDYWFLSGGVMKFFTLVDN